MRSRLAQLLANDHESPVYNRGALQSKLPDGVVIV
jgi:hypothetical protein